MSVQQEKFKKIADKIREKTKESGLIAPNKFSSKIDDVYNAGYLKAYKECVSSFPTHTVIPDGITSLRNSLFYNTWGVESVYIPDSVERFANGVFMNCYALKETNIPPNVTQWGANMFHTAEVLEKITFKNITPVIHFNNSNMTHKCAKLTTIIIEDGEICLNWLFPNSPLSKESITTIINHLSDNTTGLTAGFKKSAVDKAFETSDGALDGEMSDEWLRLISTKTNWTISLL